MPVELTAPPPVRYEIYPSTSSLAVTPPLPDLSGDTNTSMDVDVCFASLSCYSYDSDSPQTEELTSPLEIRVASDPSKRGLMDAVLSPEDELEEAPIMLHIKAEPLDEDDKVKLSFLRHNVGFPLP